MRLDRFDLNLLVVLDALLEERNVTRASQRLHIGQSAASGALARLRDYFGDELLVPVGRRLVLTPLAQSLVEPVRDTLLRARTTIARKPVFDPATSERRFVICASDYVITVLMAEAVRRISRQAPGMLLDIRSPMPHVAEVFERGSIDLLVMPQQYLQQHAHPRLALFEDTQVCLVSADHPEIGASLTFEQYMAMGHVTVRLGDERSLTFEEWFLPRYGQQRRIELSVDSFSMLPLVVIGTRRIATLHRKLAENFSRHLPVRVVEAPFDMPPVIETMAWPIHLDHDLAHQWLRTQIAASILPVNASAGSAVGDKA